MSTALLSSATGPFDSLLFLPMLVSVAVTNPSPAIRLTLAESHRWKRRNKIPLRYIQSFTETRPITVDEISPHLDLRGLWYTGERVPWDRVLVVPPALIATRTFPTESGWARRGPASHPFWLLSLTKEEAFAAHDLSREGTPSWEIGPALNLPEIPWPGVVLDWHRLATSDPASWDREDVAGYAELRRHPLWMRSYPMFDQEAVGLLETMDRRIL